MPPNNCDFRQMLSDALARVFRHDAVRGVGAFLAMVLSAYCASRAMSAYGGARIFALSIVCVCAAAVAISIVFEDQSANDESVIRAICRVADRANGVFTIERVIADLPGANIALVERVVASLEARARVTWTMNDEGVVLWSLPGHANAREAVTETARGSSPASSTIAASLLP